MLKLISAMFSLFLLLIQNPGFAQSPQKEHNKANGEVLVFYKAEGFWHNSIPTGRRLIAELAEDHNFVITQTNDSREFLSEEMKKYHLVIFINTSGDVFDEKEQVAFKEYIENGGSFLGIHAAADTELGWPWFGELVGGYFNGHPEVQQAQLRVNMPKHPTVSHLPGVWTRTDEWYNYKTLHPENKVLLYLDEASYKGGTNGEKHPIAWWKETGYGGVSIYTGSGHTIASYMEPSFKEHILQSILFALEARNN